MREMNYQKATKVPRKTSAKKPEPKTEEQKTEDKKVGNMKMQERCAPLIGRSPNYVCLLYTSPSPRDLSTSRMPSSA